MGREVRMVPANWDHPMNERGQKQPMFDESYEDVRKRWLIGLDEWNSGKNPEREVNKRDDGSYYDYWEWEADCPDREYYRPWKDADATWFQIWETVSEGTPVTPPFATKEELIEYLAKNGDEWDQSRCQDPDKCRLFGLTFGQSGWGKEQAEKFVNGPGWAPSMVMSENGVQSGVEFVTSKNDD